MICIFIGEKFDGKGFETKFHPICLESVGRVVKWHQMNEPKPVFSKVSMSYKFSESQRVSFDYSGMQGVGWVRGVSTTELPIIGCTYIIEVSRSSMNLPTDVYPFTTICIPEIGIKAVK